MITCIKCKKQKDDSEFHADKSSRDGKSHRCKECQKTRMSEYLNRDGIRNRVNKQSVARVRRYRKNNPEFVEKENSAKRKRSHTEEFRKKRKEYMALDRMKKSKAESTIKWRTKNREKAIAHKRVQYAVDSGKIKRNPCSRCGSVDNIHAHHEDYKKPLDIVWLCCRCHAEKHARTVAAD